MKRIARLGSFVAWALFASAAGCAADAQHSSDEAAAASVNDALVAEGIDRTGVTVTEGSSGLSIGSDHPLSLVAPNELSTGITLAGLHGPDVRVRPELASPMPVQRVGQSAVYRSASSVSNYVTADKGGALRIVARFTSADVTEQAFDFDLPAGGRLAINNETGGVALLDEEGAGFGTILRPWARDANGKRLPVHFRLVGDKRLVLSVDGRGAAFPVIADPAVTNHCGWITCSTYLSRELTRVVSARTELGWGGVTAVCGVAALLGGVGGAVCAAVLAPFYSVIADRAHDAAAHNKCLKFTYIPFPLTVTYISTNNGGYCKDR